MTAGRSAIHWSVGQLNSGRGAGLGNEIFPWAKAYLGACAFSAKLAEPPWLLNPRRYDRELSGSRWRDVPRYFALTNGPSLSITVDMVAETGCLDYYDAITQIATSWGSKTPRVIVHASGMALGYRGIRRARPYLQWRLVGQRAALRVSAEMDSLSTSKLRVGVHLRGADFEQGATLRPGSFNQVTPVLWYARQILSLTELLGSEFIVYAAGDSEMVDQLDAYSGNRTQIRKLAGTSVEDLAALVNCDLILPSVSSFSMLALFLGSAMYTWPDSHLTNIDGYKSIWGTEEPPKVGQRITEQVVALDYQDAESLGAKASSRRIIAQSNSISWPSGFVDRLNEQIDRRNDRYDLIYHGSIRDGL